LPVEVKPVQPIRKATSVDLMHFLVVYIVAIMIITWPKSI